jgi:cytochrome c oxidase subunit 4
MANDSHEQEHEHSARPYIFTVLALFALTVTTYTFAKHDFGRLSFLIAMVIAVTKGTLVALFFMHLKDQRGASRLTLIIAVLFVLLLITLVLADLNTRFPLALPPGSFRYVQ